MKSTGLVCALLLSCLWQSCQGSQLWNKGRAEQPTNDVTYQVERKAPVPNKDETGVSLCLSQVQPPPANVRFQSLLTASGSSYTRQLVAAQDMACFEGSPNATLSAGDIAACADAAEGAGMNAFRWARGECTGFLAWRPRVYDNCQDGGSTLLYVRQEPVTPIAGIPPSNVSGSIVYNGTHSATLMISFNSSSCGTVDNKGFKLGWNGTEVTTIPEGVLEYNLDQNLLCYISTNLSLWSIGADGETNSDEVVVEIDRSQIYWFGLSTGDCLYLYNVDNELDYAASRAFCGGLGAGLVTEKQEGDFLAFSDAFKQYLADHPSTQDDDFYVGLKYNITATQWVWDTGLVLSNSSLWATATETANSTVNSCAYAYKTASKDWRLKSSLCISKKYQGCLDRPPL